MGNAERISKRGKTGTSRYAYHLIVGTRTYGCVGGNGCTAASALTEDTATGKK